MEKDILIADDDPLIRRLLKRVLEEGGFHALEAVSGKDALDKVREKLPSLMILDLNLGDLSGLDVCAAIKNDRQMAHIPILVLTGGDEAGANIVCLDRGADDYMTKPFDGVELTARVKAILRRVKYGGRREEIIERNGISIDVGRRAILWKNQIIENLTPKEFDIIALLVENSPNTVDRTVLAKKIWNSDLEIIHDRTIDVHIRRIRLKLGPEMSGRLLTVQRSGYKFV